MENLSTTSAHDTGKMTSLQIAEIVVKPHNDVLKAIRNMEPAWVKVCKGKFSLTSNKVEMPNGGFREEFVYELSKTECLYIATKFNDEARARLVLRWEQLETKETAIANAKIRQAQASAKRRNEISLRIHDIDISITKMMSERKLLVKERNVIDNQDYAVLSFPMFPEFDCLRADFPNKANKLNN
jgi:phage regulator Rha-like protein